MSLEAAEEPSRNDDKQIGRGEDRDRSDDCADHACDEVSGEGPHDHYRPRTNQTHRHRVGELLLGQPVVAVDKALVEEGDDSQAGTERECARFGEKEGHREQ